MTQTKKERAAELAGRATSREVAKLEKELAGLRKRQGTKRHESLKRKIRANTKKKHDWNLIDLGRKLNCPLLDMEEAIEELRKEGLELTIHGGQLYRHITPPSGSGETHFSRLQKGGWLKVGVLGDTQIGNRHQRLDVLNTAYDHYESEGIEVVYHTGNLVDGYLPRINQHELLPEAGTGIESQLAYAHTKYPHKKGIRTYFVTGECHEGWWAKGAGINIGRVMQDRFRMPLSCEQIDKLGNLLCQDVNIEKGFCKTHGRFDLRYVGHEEFRIPFLCGYLPRINQHELLPEAGTGIESQLAYAHTKYPHKKGIRTYFVTGECHEGWWAKGAGINIGRVMQDRFRMPLSCEQIDKLGNLLCQDVNIEKGFCKTHGRFDLRYVGHEEFDAELRVPQLKRGVRGPMVRVMHPGGGTAYALSYKPQKIAESLQGGEKPAIQLIGHYHKFDYNYHREIHNVTTGCLEDQTMFMRKLTIPAHVGYLIVHLYIGRDGILERFRVEWIPWYDKGFYQKYETW